MTDRFPLIANSTANQIQELATGDTMDLTGNNINAVGIITATNAVKITGNTASTSTSTGALVVSGGVGIAKSLFVGEGISIAGTITYNDVTNIDSVGVVTAREAFKAGTAVATAATIYKSGSAQFIGIVTAAQFSTPLSRSTIGVVTTAYITNDNVTTLNVGVITNTSTIVGSAITLTGSGIINAGFTTITGATETVSVGTTYPTPDSSNTKVTLELDASKGTVFTHDVSNGNVGIVSLTNIPVRGNSLTTYTIIFDQLSSTPVGTGNTLPKNGIGTNVFLQGGFTGFSTTSKYPLNAAGVAGTVTLSATASDVDIVTFGVHYNGGTTTVPASFKVFCTRPEPLRTGYWAFN